MKNKNNSSAVNFFCIIKNLMYCK